MSRTSSISSITRRTIALALGSALAAAPAMAQGKGHGNGKGKGRGGEGVPPGQMPPAGMCRIWIDGVPPGHQPAPTDCATAMRNRPSNARVIFGDDTNGRRRDDDDRYEDRRDRRDRGDRDRDEDRDEDRNDDRYRRTDSGVYDSRQPQTRTQPRTSSGPVIFGHPFPGTTNNFANQPLPLMSAATDMLQGRRSGDVSRWLGSQTVSPRTADMNRDGTPERVNWFDGNGRLVQVWTDRNRDGRADRVEIYRDGRRVQVVQR